MSKAKSTIRSLFLLTVGLAVVWAALIVDGWTADLAKGWIASLAEQVGLPVTPSRLADAAVWLVMTAMFAAATAWSVWARRRSALPQAVVLTCAYVAGWAWVVSTADLLGAAAFRSTFAQYGMGGLFLIGLGWVVWLVERASQRYEADRLARGLPAVAEKSVEVKRFPRVWNPLDASAWYYGRKSRRLNQSLVVLTSYCLLFLVAGMLISQLRGCEEIYEIPAGGGQAKASVQTVKIQKVIKKKFVINPFSSIIFAERPIDDVKLLLAEATAHAYKVGYGQGEGAGFAGGTKQGKVRFIRLEYPGGDWNQDFGIGADLNMLIEYGVRTGQKVNDLTESRTVGQLAAFPVGKSPPLVYLTGQGNISLSKSDIKVLREYLIDKHGMIFGDNGGSSHFHNQFFTVMRQVLPDIEPVRMPLDDIIHRQPFPLPQLPYVAPHGGKDAWGWKVDGRWVCYYHPGDIGDAWSDGHSGVDRVIYEQCFQLGTNVIYYAHAEYAKWLQARSIK